MSEQTTEQTTEQTSQDQSTTSSETDQTTDQTSQDTQTEEQSSSGIAGALDDNEQKDKPEKDKTDDVSDDNTGDDTSDKSDESSEDNKDEESQDDQEYELELSDDSPLSQEELDMIAEYAAENNLTKEEAQGLIDNREALVNQGLTLAQQQMQQKYKKLSENFNSDPEFSGEKRAENFMAIKKAVDEFGDDQLREALNDPIVGNNIALGKFLAKIGKMVGAEGFEGMKPNKGGPDVSDKTRDGRMKKMYPDFFKEK